MRLHFTRHRFEMAEQLGGIASDSGPFAINERVLIPFTDKNYEAKILKAEFR